MGNLISHQPAEENSVYFDAVADWWAEDEETPQEEEEPLDLSALPQELIHSIVEKLNYEDYVHLDQTSKSLTTVLNNGDFSLPYYPPTIFVNKKTVKLILPHWYYDTTLFRRVKWHVAASTAASIRAEVVEIDCRASSGRMKAVAKLFEKNKTTAAVIRVMEHVTFQPEDLNRLITVLNPNHLECRQFLPREFFMNPEDGLNKVCGLTMYTTGCTDEELVKLKVPYVNMHNDFITDRGLNRLLRQWKKQDREINWFCIEFGSTFGTRNFDTILQDLGANPVWTPGMHEHSLVGGIKLEEFALMQTGDPEHVYSLWNVDNPNHIRMLYLSQGRVEIALSNNEASTLLGFLDDDQFYEIEKMCRWCELESCCHRRWCSTQRFKKSFPAVNDAVISGIKVAGTVFFAARCAQLLFGAASSHFPLSNDDVKRIHHEEDAGLSLLNTVMYTLRVYFLNH